MPSENELFKDLDVLQDGPHPDVHGASADTHHLFSAGNVIVIIDSRSRSRKKK